MYHPDVNAGARGECTFRHFPFLEILTSQINGFVRPDAGHPFVFQCESIVHDLGVSGTSHVSIWTSHHSVFHYLWCSTTRGSELSHAIEVELPDPSQAVEHHKSWKFHDLIHCGVEGI
jgi:hypothetical protein